MLINNIIILDKEYTFNEWKKIFSEKIFLARVVFKMLFWKDIKARAKDVTQSAAKNEQETIADIFKEIDEIREEIAHEHRRRKVLEKSIKG